MLSLLVFLRCFLILKTLIICWSYETATLSTVMWMLFEICSLFLLDSSDKLYLTENPGVYFVTYKMCVRVCVWDLNRQPLSVFRNRTYVTEMWSIAFSPRFQGSNHCYVIGPHLRKWRLESNSEIFNCVFLYTLFRLPKKHTWQI